MSKGRCASSSRFRLVAEPAGSIMVVASSLGGRVDDEPPDDPWARGARPDRGHPSRDDEQAQQRPRRAWRRSDYGEPPDGADGVTSATRNHEPVTMSLKAERKRSLETARGRTGTDRLKLRITAHTRTGSGLSGTTAGIGRIGPEMTGPPTRLQPPPGQTPVERLRCPLRTLAGRELLRPLLPGATPWRAQAANGDGPRL